MGVCIWGRGGVMNGAWLLCRGGEMEVGMKLGSSDGLVVLLILGEVGEKWRLGVGEKRGLEWVWL